MKVKLIQFADSYRPPYYGTYRRRGRPAVTGRRPFATHTLIDYDVDSDAEWEEEPTDADECVESEKSDDEVSLGFADCRLETFSAQDADAIDDEDNIDPDTGKPFFVPHGYLSGSEGEQGDEDENTPVADGEERRARLAAMAEAWKTTKMFADKASARLHPLVIGPYWPGLDGQQPCDAPLLDTLTRCRVG
jgi:chromatin assembly factor 1 subunit A